MADVPTIDIVNGLPTTGTGTVKTISTITDLLGALNVTKETNPDAASATTNALLRGFLSLIVSGTAAALPAQAGTIIVGGVGIDQTTDGTTNLVRVAAIAHDAVDSGNPIKIGGKVKANLSGVTLATADNRTNANYAGDGAQFVRIVPFGDIVSGVASNTDGATTAVIAAAGAGIKQYLKCADIVNMHATTVVYVELKSGTTVMWRLPVPPGGVCKTFDPPLPPNAANEAWNFDSSAAVTTLYFSALAIKSKI